MFWVLVGFFPNHTFFLPDIIIPKELRANFCSMYLDIDQGTLVRSPVYLKENHCICYNNYNVIKYT